MTFSISCDIGAQQEIIRAFARQYEGRVSFRPGTARLNLEGVPPWQQADAIDQLDAAFFNACNMRRYTLIVDGVTVWERVMAAQLFTGLCYRRVLLMAADAGAPLDPELFPCNSDRSVLQKGGNGRSLLLVDPSKKPVS